MTKEQSNQMFGVDSISDWLDNASVCSPFVLYGKTAMAISLLSDVQEFSFGNNGEAVRTALNRVKFLLDLAPREELERRTVAKLMRYLERKGFEIIAVADGEERYDTSDHAKAMGHIFAVEMANLYVHSHVDGVGREHGIFLIPGNGEDILADWNYSEPDADGFERAMDEFEPPKEPA